MAKKKVVKRASSNSSSARRMDNNTFLMIVGGGFVVIVLISMFMMGSRETTMVTANQDTYQQSMNESNNENANIVVTSPKTDESIERPITITGKARVFENVVSYRVKDEDGFVLVSGSTTYESEDVGEFGEFTVTTNYLEPKSAKGTVEVYNASAKDGSDENLVSVPVMFE